MKSTESHEKELENDEKKDGNDNKEKVDLDPLEKFHKLNSLTSKEEDPIDDDEKDAKKDEKPWRQNMKKSVSKECKYEKSSRFCDLGNKKVYNVDYKWLFHNLLSISYIVETCSG